MHAVPHHTRGAVVRGGSLPSHPAAARRRRSRAQRRRQQHVNRRAADALSSQGGVRHASVRPQLPGHLALRCADPLRGLLHADCGDHQVSVSSQNYVNYKMAESQFSGFSELTRDTWSPLAHRTSTLICVHHCCSQSKCYYIEGGCLSSPRWLSLLVAEIYYPDAYLPPDSRPSVPRSPVQGGEPPATPLHYQQFSSRAGVAADKTAAKPHCDGVDDLGCFQVSKVLPNQLLIHVLPIKGVSFVPFLNPLRLGSVCSSVRLYDHLENWSDHTTFCASSEFVYT